MGRLDRRLRRVSRRLGDFAVDLQRQVAIAIGEDVVRSTPVDTGFARGNWLPGLNAPPLVPASTLDPTALAAPARIAAAAELLRLGDTFYITNNAPYIDLLNRGYSPQAAAGYVARSVDRGLQAGIQIAVRNFRARNPR